MALTFDDYKDVHPTGSTDGTPIRLGTSDATIQVIHTKGTSEQQMVWMIAKNKTNTTARVSLTVNGEEDILNINSYSRKNVIGPAQIYFGYAGVTVTAFIDSGSSGDVSLDLNIKEFQPITTQ